MAAEYTVEISDDSFEAEVIEYSRRVPVVADFWASWCGPCRQLTPLLERLTDEFAGAFRLAKINTEVAVATAQALRVQSIPLVIGFKGGKAVTEFQGLQPEPVVRELITRILPTPADELTREGDRFAAAGNAEVAGERYRSALGRERNHPAALLGLARLCFAAGDGAAAMDWLDRGLPVEELAEHYERLRAQIRLADGGTETGGDLETLRSQAQSRSASATEILVYCKALAAAGEFDPSLERLLALVVASDGDDREHARQAVVDVLALMPPRDERIPQYRRELGKALFR